ncbi:glycosyltransferase [Hymenobacter siberiensis]|uniref:glycosyltransferase n=1 Tax=Hymenobacter siberiensis TaxID=2848396 RepID=UPI001C1DEA2D|nr:glycosyltransferase [Hymenobacter siberiensis]MBU6122877.1 glycosyltransferase [Hymenobacter siberiensis]
MSIANYPATDRPKVSVFMMAYNHAPYIRQALDSVLAQQTNFSVEIVIGEDCSTDDTRSIIIEYVEQYPGHIRALLHDVNMGASRNQVLVLENCTGEYIALLEGDDYWIDPHKLQKQIDFLDNHLDYAISAHNVVIVGGEGDLTAAKKLYYTEPPFDTYTMVELAKGNVLPTAACVCRNNFTAGPTPTGFPEWLKQAKIGDFCLHMLAARFGKIKYFPEVMGAYRVHQGGVWSVQNEVMRNAALFDTIQLLKQEFSGKARQSLNEYQLHSLSEISDQGRLVQGFSLADILMPRQDAVLALIKEEYIPFMQDHFTKQQVASSAEYRYGEHLLRPLRWLLNKARR